MKSCITKSMLLAAVIAALAAIGLVGCSNTSAGASSVTDGLTGGVAATVDGEEIMEDDVTTLIQAFRSSQGYDTEKAWGEYLASMGENVAEIREDYIGQFVAEKLVIKACAERGIEATDEELDEAVANMRANYNSDEAWASALEQVGQTEETYREMLRTSILENKLRTEIAADAEAVSDEDRLEAAQMYASFIDGSRRSSHILFNLDDKETAEKVLAQIKSGEVSFEDAVKEYSQDTSAANGGDVGWDRINSFVTEYAEALEALNEGQISDLVESQYGYHIIKCTEIYTMPEGGVTSLDQVPEALIDIINSELETNAQSEAVNKWYTEYKEAADIVINDMPEGLPYDIDLTPYNEALENQETPADGTEDEDNSLGPEGEEGDEDVIIDDEGPVVEDEKDVTADEPSDASSGTEEAEEASSSAA